MRFYFLNKNKNKIRDTKGIFILLFILAVCMLTGCKNKIKSNYKLGAEYITEEKYQDALMCLEQAEKDGISIKKIYRLRGIAYIGLCDYENAVANLENALLESNGIVTDADIDLNYYLATAYYKLGNYDRADEIYSAIMEIRPKDPRSYYLRGCVSLKNDKLSAAQEDFSKAVACNKLDATQYIRIYRELCNAGYNAEAISYINLALSNISKPSEYELGIFNYYIEDYTQARNHLEASKESKNTAEGVVYLGKTYVALGDTPYAISLCEAFINAHPEAPSVLNELGIMYAKESEYERALECFEKGLELNAGTDRQYLMFNRIVALERTGQFTKAKEFMKEYVEMYPMDEKAERENIFLSSR